VKRHPFVCHLAAVTLGCATWFAMVDSSTAQSNPAVPPATGNPLNEPLGDPGVVPVGSDGKPLNLNFETGTLEGWTAEGQAFVGQPIKGDIRELRPADRKASEHTGQYWIGGYEKLGDRPTGTLTSPTFEVTHPYASFLVGGGASRQTRVDLVTADDNRVFYTISGKNQENLRPVIVDMRPVQGRKIFIRLVDQASGGWGHINFDDFRFHATRPRFRSLTGELPVPEVKALYPHAGLSAEEAAKAMVVPPGFSVQVAAAEPDVRQPIAMAMDDRGRLWIAEAYEYPVRAKGDAGRDRILIFEDTDLDGRLDKRTVFYEGLNLVSGLEVGFGGVWVGAAPYLLFLPDRDGDDRPDGEPVKLLDGWGWQDTHETLNSFLWGPDGWLYGCHGVFTHSRVGKPGTPDAQRVPINAGFWRYHPVRHEFEVFAHGTSNPWGIDYDRQGNFFATACVIPHIYHVILGARYERQAGQHFNPYTYDDIKTIADHRHYTGNQWNDDNRRQSDTLGGGHAHAGCMIYQGAAWPEKYWGAVFMNNIHGNRVNVDHLAARGSGFVAHHGQDFLLTRDQWSQMLDLEYGPDGQVWAIDWYDMQQCHRPDPKVHDRSNGRIYRIAYGGAPPVRVDLQRLSDAQLVDLLAHANEWYRRHAQRILQERAATQALAASVPEQLGQRLAGETDEARALRWLWALRVVSGTPGEFVQRLKALPPALARVSPSLRAWAVRLAGDGTPRTGPGGHRQGPLPAQVVELAGDEHPAARLAAASELLQYAPTTSGQVDPAYVEALTRLTARRDDAADPNLPLLCWYALEPLAEADPPRALALALEAGQNLPLLKEFTIRRIGAGDPARSLELLVTGLADAHDEATQLTFLRGLEEALTGRRDVPVPARWSEVRAKLSQSSSSQVRLETTVLAAAWGDDQALEALAATALDTQAPLPQRRRALAALARAAAPRQLPVLLALVSQGPLRGEALRLLAAVEDARVPATILSLYPELTPAERRDALATLASRPGYAAALLDAVASGKVPTSHLTADLVTSLRNLNDPVLLKRIEELWGVVRSSPAEKAQLIEEYKRLLTVPAAGLPLDTSPQPHRELGRAVFARTCQQCHTLFGTGGKVGPDITGSQRTNLDYLLSNLLDPSAVMAKEYQPTVVRMADGRVLTGIVKEESPSALKLQTANELVVLPQAEIEERKLSDKSMMPDDLLRPLTPREVRALVAYLQADGQTPMQATFDNVAAFFNGRDLTGWVGDPKLWSVEDGEIVGRSPGLKKNEFLISELSVGDFELSLEVKLVDDQGNSGIQIRSQPIEHGLMRGYQCDIGPGWWGKLYEEHGRGLLEAQGAEAVVKKGAWNQYRIVAAGSRVRAWLNGQLCFDRDDPTAARRGVIGLQLHSGGPMEVRFRHLTLKLLPDHVPARPYPATRAAAPRSPEQVQFRKTTLDRAFRSEGVAMGDFNQDGRLDIAAGSVWYAAPEKPGDPWTLHVLGEKPNQFDIRTYGDTFMNWADDVDGDGRLDLIVVDFPGKQTWWFQNPGVAGQAARQPWKKHVVVPVTNNESPQYVDLDGDGRRELVYGDAAQRLAIARPQHNPLVEWRQQPISSPGDVTIRNFYHGLGIGDVNRDGRDDVLVPDGWWEAPRTAGENGTSDVWTFHAAPFGEPQAQMYVFDVDGDGDNDVVGSSAHRRGIWWYEQDGSQWTRHLIDDSIAQTHALVLADINGDGLPDLVTGKRFYAHNGRDPGEDEPPELAWFALSREGGKPRWTKHLIDDDSGVGTQFEVHDMNGDGRLDIVIANKRGVFYFEQQAP
jgi:putative membrane-bound dehydrogenase-like protein